MVQEEDELKGQPYGKIRVKSTKVWMKKKIDRFANWRQAIVGKSSYDKIAQLRVP